MDTTRDYWLILKPQVYIMMSTQRILLYNTEKGVYIESDEPSCIELIDSARDEQNKGVRFLPQKVLNNNRLITFIRKLQELQMVELKPADNRTHKPESLLPVYPEKSPVFSKDIMLCLTTLYLYINTTCKQKCPFCELYYKQNPCCTRTKCGEELTIEQIKRILKEARNSPLGKIHILGGDLLQYSRFPQLVEILEKANTAVHYWINYKNTNELDTRLLNKIKYWNVLVDFPLDQEQLQKNIALFNGKAIFYFLIHNEEQREIIETVRKLYHDIRIRIIPIYNNKNQDFFETEYYLSKSDIFSKPISQCRIWRNQTVNSNNFGALYIFPDGKVKTNPNAECLGDFHTSSLEDLLTKEVELNTSWLKIRDNETHCKDCLYRHLCPPPSNYEHLLGKANLCHVI
ncbi:hypothetical protein AGMMS50262_02960 [Bacteroidia bacterium]|nr:hypothetical protein AGMMS50262_02960 [Bacteroidia bacterium]